MSKSRWIVGACIGASMLGGVAMTVVATGCAGAEKAPDSPAGLSGAAPAGDSACTKDTDCKGDRICTKGACVDPNAGK